VPIPSPVPARLRSFPGPSALSPIELLVIDNDKKRREQEPAPLLTINGETLQTMNLDDACRYLGYCGTGNGDMKATKEVVRQTLKDHCST